MHEHSPSLGHVPLIYHHARGGEKEQFEPADAVRYKERTVAERSNARLKDEFGGRNIRARGPDKVMSHSMFGLLELTVDQLMHLFTSTSSASGCREIARCKLRRHVSLPATSGLE